MAAELSSDGLSILRAWRLTNQSSNIYISTKDRTLSQMPLNIGRPARLCATPIVKGFAMPAAKPQPAARSDIATPVTGSQPRATASATTIGAIGMTSSKDPTRDPIAMKKSTRAAMSLYFTFPNLSTILPSM